MVPKRLIDLEAPDANPVWWVGSNTAEHCLEELQRGIIPSTTFVKAKNWIDARTEAAVNLGLEPHSVICVKATEWNQHDIALSSTSDAAKKK
jgi:hypothetical protein